METVQRTCDVTGSAYKVVSYRLTVQPVQFVRNQAGVRRAEPWGNPVVDRYCDLGPTAFSRLMSALAVVLAPTGRSRIRRRFLRSELQASKNEPGAGAIATDGEIRPETPPNAPDAAEGDSGDSETTP